MSTAFQRDEQTPVYTGYVAPPAFLNGNPADRNEQNVLGWLSEARQEGIAYLNTQPGYGDMDRAIDIISGLVNEKNPESPTSKVSANLIKRDIREIVSVLSDLRDFWMFEASDHKWDEHANILNKLTNSWYHENFADLSIREALQYAATLGTGYLSPYWHPHAGGRFKGDIMLEAYGARDVYPVQMPPTHDLQQAYAVVIKQEMPITTAWRLWPHLRFVLKPDREVPTAAKNFTGNVIAAGKAVIDWIIGTEKNREDETTPFPVVDLFYTYVNDFAINTTGKAVPMGDPGTNYSYIVPALNSDIPAGFNDVKQTVYRKATKEDCYLYPNRRLIISTRTVVIYDGPSYWWHGQVPLVKFTLDDWAWNYLGFSLVRDVASLQDSMTSHLRNIDDSASARLNPPFGADRSVPVTDFERFNPRLPGQRFRFDSLRTDKPFYFPYPIEGYDVPQWIIDRHLPYLSEMIHNLLGTQDAQALLKARQLPSSDSIEKINEMASPIVRAMSRNMERSLRGLGGMIGSLFFQFYDTKRRLKVLGTDGITEEDYDFDPQSLIPADPDGFATSRMERARIHQDNFKFKITPGSLHQINRQFTKMLYIQLRRMGFKIDSETMSRVLEIPNWGTLPGKNVLEKWMHETGMDADLQARLMQMAQAMQQGGAPPDGGSGLPGQPTQKGRPPSGGQPAHLESRDHGERTVLSES